jgi:hypothetical protein
MHHNRSGFQCLEKFLFDVPLVKNETTWILQHLYCSRLDKATNNACFICIKHIRLQALQVLILLHIKTT